ncbi:hypothetical protein BTO32_15225 [Marinobacter lutaoensis]|uniref:Uncharacterized protein n=2 Tax=Marinobacter lutaoensis TaxID=135739 RepID=A0A1V2DPK8_9GAMM|nr:hypothetical protein BTO32_15225 [Marinobacter lutaoensis]
MRMLSQVGLLPAISRLGQLEACLSIVGSAAIRSPILVLEKRLPEATNRLPISAINRLSDHYVREQMAERLASLGINLMLDYPYQPSSPERTAVHSNRAVLYGDASDRSFSVKGPGVCLVALDTDDLAGDLMQEMPYAWSLLGTIEQEYLKRWGNAIEFWHEIAHCNSENAFNDLSLIGEQAAHEIQRYSERWAQEAQECDPVVGESLLSVLEMTLVENPDNPMLALDAVQAAGGFDSAVGKDQILRFRLFTETLADSWAKFQIQRRKIANEGYCSSENAVTHPWDRFRLAMSIRQPDARYMTWLVPWLKGLPEHIQRQVIADAYEGVMRLAEELVPKSIVMKLVSEREARPDVLAFSTPNLSPDSRRADRWKHWAQENLGTSFRY